MAEHPIQGLMGVTIEKIRDMVNAETIIGDPIHVDDTTIIPVSRVTFGFVSGGSDVAPQLQQADVRRRQRCRCVGHAGCIPGGFRRQRAAPYSWWRKSPPWITL